METQESVPVDDLSVGSLSKMHMQDLFIAGAFRAVISKDLFVLDALQKVDKLLSENPCSAVEKLLKTDSTLEIFTPIDLALIPSLSTQSQHV